LLDTLFSPGISGVTSLWYVTVCEYTAAMPRVSPSQSYMY